MGLVPGFIDGVLTVGLRRSSLDYAIFGLVIGRLLPVKVESKRRVHLGESKSWLSSLDLFRTAPVGEGLDKN